MRILGISDITLATEATKGLSFKEKTETAKQLVRAAADCIELSPVTGARADAVLYHTVSGFADCELCCPISTDDGRVAAAREALKEAKHPAVNICVPVSVVQMEYIGKKKPAAMLAALGNTLARARENFDVIEVSLLDATRADESFLLEAVKTAAEGGTTRITVCDDAGDMLPREFGEFISRVIAAAENVKIGIKCRNDFHMAASFMTEGVTAGIDYIKTTAVGKEAVSLRTATGIVKTKGSVLGCACNADMTVLDSCVDKIALIFEGNAPHGTDLKHIPAALDKNADIAEVARAAKELGFELGGDDISAVYAEFKKTAEKKAVTLRDLDAIIAGCAMQVPPTFTLQSFVVTNGNVITPMANITIKKGDEQLLGCSVGDGPIDAAFRAIEKIVGSRFELDDFQIQAVTHGREALGSAVVKLRADGVLYSGKGISTDIVEASIAAYISALNKIYFEEAVK